MLGMIDVYNILPASIVEQCPCVKSFQSALQTLASKCASRGVDEWHHMYSSRCRMHVHPLLQMWSYDHSLSDTDVVQCLVAIEFIACDFVQVFFFSH